MALEIRELIIKVQVSDDNGRTRQSLINEQQISSLKREIMNECMDKLKQEFDKKKDR